MFTKYILLHRYTTLTIFNVLTSVLKRFCYILIKKGKNYKLRCFFNFKQPTCFCPAFSRCCLATGTELPGNLSSRTPCFPGRPDPWSPWQRASARRPSSCGSGPFWSFCKLDCVEVGTNYLSMLTWCLYVNKINLR